jgi:hypothetical protein
MKWSIKELVQIFSEAFELEGTVYFDCYEDDKKKGIYGCRFPFYYCNDHNCEHFEKRLLLITPAIVLERIDYLYL